MTNIYHILIDLYIQMHSNLFKYIQNIKIPLNNWMGKVIRQILQFSIKKLLLTVNDIKNNRLQHISINNNLLQHNGIKHNLLWYIWIKHKWLQSSANVGARSKTQPQPANNRQNTSGLLGQNCEACKNDFVQYSRNLDSSGATPYFF